MESELTNTVTALGNYNNIPTSVSSLASVVTMISGLTITKTADKPVWADGLLTYTITVNNSTSQAYTSVVVTDILDTTKVDFVTDSVEIDGSKAATEDFKFENNTLTVQLSDVAPSGTKTITFQVKKKE